MGLIFGKVNVETPKYGVVAKAEGFEIREYVPALAAEVSYDARQLNGGFIILANYIGALGQPNNVRVDGDGGEKIAMTAPVLMQEEAVDCHEKDRNPESDRVQVTAAALTQKAGRDDEGGKTVTMQFILPSKYTCVSNTPHPTDPRVSLKELPRRRYGVLGFSGIASEKLTEKKVQKLRKALQEEGYSIRGEHILAQYNPPWTIPLLRTNEILLPVD